jgi:hypothetical protein
MNTKIFPPAGFIRHFFRHRTWDFFRERRPPYSKSLLGAGLPDGSGSWVRRTLTSSGVTSNTELPNEL